MSIWFDASLQLSALNERAKNSLVSHLGILFTELGDDYLVGRMPVDERTRQPLGIMHGGASCVLAETLGSTAANYCIDSSQRYGVGLDINTNHIRAIRSGHVIGTAKPFHLGKTTQVWEIQIKDEQDRLISVTRLTVMLLNKTVHL